MRGFRSAYGGSPLHLLSMLGCFALAGVAALQLADSPAFLRIVVWFVGAALVHDLLLYPLYMLADRSAQAGLARAGGGPGSVNWVRVPTLLSGLLLLLFWPVITQHSEGAYRRASGLTLDPYLERYLAITGALYLGSALLFALTRRRRRA